MEQNEKQCPYCGQTIKAQAQKCRFCGQWLNQVIEDYKPTTIHCPYCREEILPIAKKCKHCGEMLVKQENNNTKTLNDKKDDNKTVVGPFSIITSIVWIVLVINYFSNNDMTTETFWQWLLVGLVIGVIAGAIDKIIMKQK